MQLSSTQHSPHIFADRDLYYNTLRYADEAISAQIVDVPEHEPLVDDVPGLQPLAEDGIQFPESVMTGMFTEMEEDTLADNLDILYGTEHAIEQTAQDTLRVYPMSGVKQML